jgi:hypothetical protein
MLLLLRG